MEQLENTSIPQVEEQLEEPVEITIQSLLESGAHFGSKKDSWNPKAAGYIYGLRNDIYIINLDTTLQMWKKAQQVIIDTTTKGGQILLVGTKERVRDTLIKIAVRSNCHYVSHRWLGGTLTNLETLRKSVNKLIKLEALIDQASSPDSKYNLTKKEILKMRKEASKLNKFFGGLKQLKHLPDLIFITDIDKDHLALDEARILGIPVIALVDTNVDPTRVDYPIPANDDAIATQILFLKAVEEAIKEGRRFQDEQALIDAKLREDSEQFKQESQKLETTTEVKEPKIISDIPVEYKK